MLLSTIKMRGPAMFKKIISEARAAVNEARIGTIFPGQKPTSAAKSYGGHATAAPVPPPEKEVGAAPPPAATYKKPVRKGPPPVPAQRLKATAQHPWDVE